MKTDWRDKVIEALFRAVEIVEKELDVSVVQEKPLKPENRIYRIRWLARADQRIAALRDAEV